MIIIGVGFIVRFRLSGLEAMAMGPVAAVSDPRLELLGNRLHALGMLHGLTLDSSEDPPMFEIMVASRSGDDLEPVSIDIAETVLSEIGAIDIEFGELENLDAVISASFGIDTEAEA